MINREKLYQCSEEDFLKILKWLPVEILRKFVIEIAPTLPPTHSFYKKGQKKGSDWNIKGFREQSMLLNHFQKFYFENVKDINSNPNFIEEFNQFILKNLKLDSNVNLENVKTKIEELDEEIKEILNYIYNIELSETEKVESKLKKYYEDEIEKIKIEYSHKIENIKSEFKIKNDEDLRKLKEKNEKEFNSKLKKETKNLQNEINKLKEELKECGLKYSQLESDNAILKESIKNKIDLLDILSKLENSVKNEVLTELDNLGENITNESIKTELSKVSSEIEKKISKIDFTNIDKLLMYQFVLIKLLEVCNA